MTSPQKQWTYEDGVFTILVGNPSPDKSEIVPINMDFNEILNCLVDNVEAMSEDEKNDVVADFVNRTIMKEISKHKKPNE